MLAIIVFFLAHWWLSVFFQSFFLHRYCAHRMFTMSKGWERFFYLCTFVFQGSSFLSTRGYAILHREHHAFSDTDRDPHSPHAHPNLWRMMNHTKNYYRDINAGTVLPEQRFEGGYPQWPLIDRLGERWSVRLMFGLAYCMFYLEFAPHWAWALLLPFHFLMGPIHGAIVNWCGHKYGYRNFDTKDESRNTLWLDFVTAGELFQNNHHRFGASPNFAQRRFELDPTYQVMRVFDLLGMIHLPKDRKDKSLTRTSPTQTSAAGRGGTVASLGRDPPSLRLPDSPTLPNHKAASWSMRRATRDLTGARASAPPSHGHTSCFTRAHGNSTRTSARGNDGRSPPDVETK